MTQKVSKRMRSRPGNGSTIGEQKRDRERASERIRSAHPGPCDQRGVLPGSGVFPAERSAKQARQIVGSEHPDKTNQHDHQNNTIATWTTRVAIPGARAFDDLRQLQAR